MNQQNNLKSQQAQARKKFGEKFTDLWPKGRAVLYPLEEGISGIINAIDIEDFLDTIVRDAFEAGFTTAKQPKENKRGYLVEGEPCPFCHGTGNNPNGNNLC